MTKEEIKTFNELSRKLCDEIKNKNMCPHCPFYQWDTYYNCFDEDDFEYPLFEKETE